MNTSFKLINLEYTRVDLPLVTPFTTSVTTVNHRTVLAVTAHIQLKSPIGKVTFVGYGEAAPLPGWSNETIDECIATLHELPRNQNFNYIGELDSIYPKLHRTPTLRAGVELAILDALANAHNTSIATVIARHYNPKTAQLNDTIAVQSILGTANTEDTVAHAIRAFLRGFTHLKLKIGVATPQEDLQRIIDVHTACPQIYLRLDVNGAWTIPITIQFLQNIKNQPVSLRNAIDLIEQPVDPADFNTLILQLSDLNLLETTLTIAPDESCATPDNARKLIESGTITAIVLKPAFLGGLLPTAALMVLALKNDVRVILSNAIESTIGRYATAQLAAAFPQFPGPHGLATGDLFIHDITETPDIIETGNFKLPPTNKHHKHEFKITEQQQ